MSSLGALWGEALARPPAVSLCHRWSVRSQGRAGPHHPGRQEPLAVLEACFKGSRVWLVRFHSLRGASTAFLMPRGKQGDLFLSCGRRGGEAR